MKYEVRGPFDLRIGGASGVDVGKMYARLFGGRRAVPAEAVGHGVGEHRVHDAEDDMSPAVGRTPERGPLRSFDSTARDRSDCRRHDVLEWRVDIDDDSSLIRLQRLQGVDL